MKLIFFAFTYLVGNALCAQKNNFVEFTQDTIQIKPVVFKKTVGLVFHSCIVFIEASYFREKLMEEWRATRRFIRKRKGEFRGAHLQDIPMGHPLREARLAFKGLDSAHRKLNKNLRDTIYLEYNGFFSSSRFGDFLPELIESGRCAITDRHWQIQHYIIRQIGWQKNGSFSSGSRLYFLAGQPYHFWAKWDWST